MTPPFDITMIERLFPDYLTATEKRRLLQALEQFKDAYTKGKCHSKTYSHFYVSSADSYFLQGDLIREIRYTDWKLSTFFSSKR
jgi:hypothetical protein